MKQRSRGMIRRGLVVAIGIAALALVVAAFVVDQRGMASQEQGVASPATVLLADIRAYRKETATLEPQMAAGRWFDLYDRTVALDKDSVAEDFGVFDDSVLGPVSEQSMFASLPPPAAWPAFRTIATQRKVLPLRYLAEILNGDRAAATATLAEIDSQETRGQVVAARALLAKLYGDAEERLAAFRMELQESSGAGEIQVPDLVAMAGESRARELLAIAITSPHALRMDGGEATGALARRVALENIERMQVPQWALAESIDGSALFEAMTRRFAAKPRQAWESSYDWSKRSATTYYFLSMVREGRQEPAEATLLKLAGEHALHIPHGIVTALQKAGLNEPLFRFLDGQLSRRPELAAWDVYIEQAAYTGHGAEALALIGHLLARKDLTREVRANLQVHHIDALLAADLVNEATMEFRELLAKPPAADDPKLGARTLAALKAAGVGRLTDDKQLAELGVRFAQSALQLPEGEDPSYELSEARLKLYGELRAQGRGEEALKMALARAGAKPSTFSEALARRMGMESDDDQRALVEIAGIHSSTGRHAQVIELLASSPRWGASDLAEVLTLVDSQREPLGAMVARALESTGDKAAAQRVARATVAALPGNDAGYEIIAALDPNAAATFEELYAGDEFEERPLIWKATALLATGSAQEAETTVRRAIAVDPSDGEEGPNDRMRAYAVLAEILRGKGDAKGHALYSNAVRAIRLSERADEFHAKGLYLRAFQIYREALDVFSDAYCIQSRLAVQLNKQGRRKEALEHYRRAYELMPSSFGRVESHCFGCESVFQGAEAQSMAEQVFLDIIRKSPDRPQAHYLLAYLREQQGRYADAVQPLRAAVSIDAHYLNAWKRLHDVADKTYVEAGERDIARLKLLELDPLQRHASYELDEVGQLAALWNGVERAGTVAARVEPPADGVYPLKASAAVKDEAMKDHPPEMRAMERQMFSSQKNRVPQLVLYEHVLVASALSLTGVDDTGEFD
jgi:tetratricopeptide (TPR) repeat protein